MGKRFYLAEHESQRNTGPLSSTNCAAASGAMLVDQATLDRKDPRVRKFRNMTGDMVGGLQANAVASAMEEFGIEVRLYDYRDNLKWWKLVKYLERGWFAVVAGDYDLIKGDIRGADFDGFHAVMYHQRFKHNQRVGDPLMDDWVKWPNDLAYKYVAKFDRQTQGGIHAVVMVPQYAMLRSEVIRAEIHEAPSQQSPVIASLGQGNRLVTGGTVKGDEIIGVDRWRKVWVPSTASVGYIHWSVTWKK